MEDKTKLTYFGKIFSSAKYASKRRKRIPTRHSHAGCHKNVINPPFQGCNAYETFHFLSAPSLWRATSDTGPVGIFSKKADNF